jgi:hypothetical protein
MRQERAAQPLTMALENMNEAKVTKKITFELEKVANQ